MFEGILGHESALDVLRRQVESGRIAHAYLFLGPAGVGKFLVAKSLAAAVLCGEGGCGVCTACRLVMDERHPCLYVLQPGEEGRIGVDEIRSLQRAVGLKSFDAGGKVVVLRDAETLTPEASNAFLKTLEEPPSGVIIVLVASDRSALLDTVVSRCQMVRFGPLPAGVVMDVLRERGVDEARIPLLALSSGGSVGSALELMEYEEDVDFERLLNYMIDGRGELFDVLAVLSGKGGGDSVRRTREVIRGFLRFLMEFLGDTRRFLVLGELPEWYTPSLKKVVESLAADLGVSGLEVLIAKVERAARDVLSNVRPDLVMYDLALFVAGRKEVS